MQEAVVMDKDLEEKYKALKTSEERHRRMIDEVEDYAIIMLDTNGIIQTWNKGAEKIKQYLPSEALGRHFEIFYLPQDRAQHLPERLLREAAKNGRAVYEGWRTRKDGTTFWGSITLTALHDNDGNITGYSKVTRDLTDKKEAELKLQEYLSELQARNRELEQFAYIASHDLQEPLRKIQTFTEVIQKNLDNKAIVSRYFEKMNTSARRMSDLITSVLNYSRLSRQTEPMVDTDLNEVMKGVETDFELVIQEKQASIIRDDLPVITAIPLQMTQLFSNLVSNALKFSKKDPIIRITSQTVKAEEIVNPAGAVTASKYIEIIVADNGIGFEQDYEKLIFMMFQRLHTKHEYDGTGIGLALCKKIMDNHRGFIRATSVPSVGTSFYLYFPLN
jgi:PAS domain S-box-containing protein